MDNQISETLIKLAQSMEKLAESIEKDSAHEPHMKVASARDFGFGGVSELPDRGDPLLSFILS